MGRPKTTGYSHKKSSTMYRSGSKIAKKFEWPKEAT